MTRILKLSALAAGAYFTGQALRRRKRIDFGGKVVLITGGSRGLGLLLARQLADEGARLAIVARTAADLERAKQDLTARGAEVLAFPCDVRDEEQVNAAVERVVKHYGRLDVLINNAGVIAVGPLDHMHVQDFDESYAVHVRGPLFAMRAAIPHMRRQGSGRIVNIASIGGKISVPHLAPYSTGKFALVGLSDGVRAELGNDKIYVTTVCPGLMRTGSPPNALFKGQRRKEYSWFAVSDALPLISIDGERAAEKIITACRYGDPALTITPQAKVGAVLNNLAPGLVANVLGVVASLLPSATGREGDTARSGWESESPMAPSPLTTLSDQAAARNNELRPEQQRAVGD